MRAFASLIVLTLFPIAATAQRTAPQYTITTIAGGALPAVGLPATGVSITNPTGIAVDSAGNIFFAGASVVFKLDSSGLLKRVAGMGGGGYSGDGGPAVLAQLSFPRAFPYDALDWGEIASGLALDSTGNLFIADMMNNRVRKVTPNGVITTAMGSSDWYQPSGVAVDGTGNLYIVSPWAAVWKANASGEAAQIEGTGFGCGSWPTSRQCVPYGIAADAAGNVYVADMGHCRVQKISVSGVISTIAGNDRPSRGGAYTCGYNGDGGPATNAALGWPYGVAVDAAGNVYIADTANSRIRKVSTDGLITTVAGIGSSNGGPSGAGYSGDGGPATSAQLNKPHGVAVDAAGNIYIADTENFRIRKVSIDGTISTVAGNGRFSYSGDGGAATSAQLDFLGNISAAPFRSYDELKVNFMTVDGFGNPGIVDASNNRLRSIDSNGVIRDASRVPVSAPLPAYALPAIPEDPVYLDEGYGPLFCGFLCAPRPIRTSAADSAGNVYFNNATNVFRLSTDGTVTTIAGNGTYGYSGDGGLAANAQLSFPAGIAVDSAGRIYIADAGNNAVRLLTPLPQPTDLTISPNFVAQGDCYVMSVSNGANMNVDVQYRFAGGPVQTILNWPHLDATGQSEKICTSSQTPIGTFEFTAMRNTEVQTWIPISTSVTVTAH